MRQLVMLAYGVQIEAMSFWQAFRNTKVSRKPDADGWLHSGGKYCSRSIRTRISNCQGMDSQNV